MPNKSLNSLGILVKEKRGDQKLRETAKEIGIGPATLMRIENGHVPDLTTFGKICEWLNVNPGDFLGEPKSIKSSEQPKEKVLESIHLKANQILKPETAIALTQMIIRAVDIQLKEN